MDPEFDAEEARRNLEAMEQRKSQKNEALREQVLQRAERALRDEFSQEEGIEVYLVGSVIAPGQFRLDSDVDIVVKGFSGDRFDLWTRLEDRIDRSVEVILFETCHFQDYVLSEGKRIV